MAGTKKNSGTQSKTARASMPKSASSVKGSAYAVAATSEINRLVPLGGGSYAYVLDPKDGKTLHMSVTSDEFVAKITEMAANGLGERLTAELDQLAVAHPGNGWGETKARLVAAGAFGGAEG